MATVYSRMYKNPQVCVGMGKNPEDEGYRGEGHWLVLDYENQKLRRADVLMDSSPPDFFKVSTPMAVGSKIYLFTASENETRFCNSLHSIDTSNADPRWISESPIPSPKTDLACAHLDGKIYIMNRSEDRLTNNDWADVFDQKTKMWYSAKVPPPLLQESESAGEDHCEYLLCPVVADPRNGRILMCYQLTAYYPDSNRAERFSSNKLGRWHNKCHVVVGDFLISSAGEVDSLVDSLFVHDLANGACPVTVHWMYSPTCKNRGSFEFVAESEWEAVLDLGDGKLCLATQATAWGRGLEYYIGGMIVELDTSREISISVIAPIGNLRSDVRDYLSIVPPHPAV